MLFIAADLDDSQVGDVKSFGSKERAHDDRVLHDTVANNIDFLLGAHFSLRP